MFRYFTLFAPLLLSFSIFAATDKAPHHMPLELSFEESLRWEEQMIMEENLAMFNSMKGNVTMIKDTAKELEPQTIESTRAGKRMNEWLKMINSVRPADQQLRLTGSNSRGNGIPIDKPSKYGPSTILEKLNKIKSEIPEELNVVMFGEADITTNLPVEGEVFVKWAKEVSRLYQTAVRWTGMQRWLDWYTDNKKRDVRGYYHLKAIKDLDDQLKNFTTLDEETQGKYKNYLIGICMNADNSLQDCKTMIELSISNDMLLKFKNNFWQSAIANWKTFFAIDKGRDDVKWSAEEEGVMHVFFKDPKNEKISAWLKENIEAEFSRPELNWNMQFNLIEGDKTTAFLEFKPNVTPHVTNGWNTIVMDENSPIEEWDTRWTIRHEYGHILHLPDCYVEFYDADEKVMVNYQLDVTDLMCSRSGDMNDRIFHELKRKYFKK